MSEEITAERVISKYRDIREKLDAERTAFKAFEKKAKQDMDRLAMWLKDYAEKNKLKNIPTDSGTAYPTTKTYVRIADWDKFLQWMIDTGNFHCVEKRPAKLNTIAVMEDLGLGKEPIEGQNEPAFAPDDIGIYYQEEVEFNVRKPGS